MNTSEIEAGAVRLWKCNTTSGGTAFVEHFANGCAPIGEPNVALPLPSHEALLAAARAATRAEGAVAWRRDVPPTDTVCFVRAIGHTATTKQLSPVRVVGRLPVGIEVVRLGRDGTDLLATGSYEWCVYAATSGDEAALLKRDAFYAMVSEAFRDAEGQDYAVGDDALIGATLRKLTTCDKAQQLWREWQNAKAALKRAATRGEAGK